MYFISSLFIFCAAFAQQKAATVSGLVKDVHHFRIFVSIFNIQKVNNESNETLLLAKQIAPTAMRIRTLEFLLQKAGAVTLADIEAHFFRADRVTLYRTLKTFEQKGLIHSIRESNTTKYALCKDACEAGMHHDEHLHFFCTECKETSCLEAVDLSAIKLPAGFVLQEFHFSARGICAQCQERHAGSVE